MSNLSHIVEGAQAVLCCRGLYHQKKVYRRGDRLFAAWAGGYLRLGPKLGINYGTSRPDVSWEYLELPEDVTVTFDKLKGPVVGEGEK